MQEAWRDVPAEYELVSQRKGFKRYKSPQLVELLREHAAAQEQREFALSSVLQVSGLPYIKSRLMDAEFGGVLVAWRFHRQLQLAELRKCIPLRESQHAVRGPAG